MKLSLWDTSGVVTYRSVTRSYFRGAAGALLVFDLTRRSTFLSAISWLHALRLIAQDDIVVVLVGNKSDLASPSTVDEADSSGKQTENRRQVTREEAEEWCRQNRVIKYVEASAKDGEGVKRAFLEVAEGIYQNIEVGKYNLTDRQSGVKGPSAPRTVAPGTNDGKWKGPASSIASNERKGLLGRLGEWFLKGTPARTNSNAADIDDQRVKHINKPPEMGASPRNLNLTFPKEQTESVEEDPELLAIEDSRRGLPSHTELFFQDAMHIASRCGWQIGGDRFLEDTESCVTAPILTGRGFLGHGKVGVVDEVRCQVQGSHNFVRKRINIPRSSTYQTTRAVQAIRREIGMLRKLSHPHIIRLIGSYQEITNRHFYFLLMFPVGENDLEEFLVTAVESIRQGSQPNALQYSLWLKTWFGCLASALAYMHSQSVYHEDIKPKNIIHRGEDIYFTDFSSSREMDLASQVTSTESPALATRLYAAPEALPDEEGNISRHGSKTDIFSLGMVFVEMLTVLDQKEIVALRENLPDYAPYHKIIHNFDDWFTSETSAHMYVTCIKPMLAPQRQDRPSALEVVDCIRGCQSWRTLVCPCQNMADFTSRIVTTSL